MKFKRFSWNWFSVSNFAPSFGIFNTWDWESQRASSLAEHYLSNCDLGIVCSDEEGEEILRQRGQFPALPFTASDCGSPSPRSPGSPASIGSYRNGGSPQAVPWDRFSVKMDTFKFPNMPTKYPNSNGRVKKKPPQQISDDIAKSPASGKCFPFFALITLRYTDKIMIRLWEGHGFLVKLIAMILKTTLTIYLKVIIVSWEYEAITASPSPCENNDKGNRKNFGLWPSYSWCGVWKFSTEMRMVPEN